MQKNFIPPHFVQTIKIFTFLKNTAKAESEIPESIKLMQYHELLDNIEHDKFETQLIKDILIFLVHYFGLATIKNNYTSLSLLNSPILETQQPDIVDRNFSEIAISQYVRIEKNEESEKYQNKQFYELEHNDKLKILCFLIDGILTKDRWNLSKKQNGAQNEILCLGNDKNNAYFFIRQLPWVVYEYRNKKWKERNREDIEKLVEQQLRATKSFRSLFLLKNMVSLLENQMVSTKPKLKKLPMHKIKNQKSEQQNVLRLCKGLDNIIERYKRYLQQISKDYEYAPPEIQASLTKKMEKTKSYRQLFELLQEFFQYAKKGVYYLEEQEYCQKFIIWANLVFKQIQVRQRVTTSPAIMLNKIIESQCVIDFKTTVELIVKLLEKNISNLQIKQNKYLKKQQKLSLKRSSASSLTSGSEELEQSKQEIKPNCKGNGMQLRTRKKKFGIVLIDSDQEYSSIKKKLRSYEYHPQ